MILVFLAVIMFYSLLFWYAEKFNRMQRHEVRKHIH